MIVVTCTCESATYLFFPSNLSCDVFIFVTSFLVCSESSFILVIGL